MHSLFTSESVTEGHPDKVADQISDAILDALLREDPHARVACETLVTTGLVLLAGEITTRAQIPYSDIARETLKRIGYDDSAKGFDYKTCSILVSLGRQSPDIAQGVDAAASKEQGAGDQGLMFGYAIRESDEFMPLSIEYAHRLAERLAHVRHSGLVPWLRPDGKTQVTMEYQDGVPVRIDTIVISAQHDEAVTLDEIRRTLQREVIEATLPESFLVRTRVLVNPTGRFVVGGPMGDCGLTGRKIIVDTYGGHGAHGGGAFSGKDPSKVDRSACYMARYIAKNLVAAGLVDRCLVQLSYAIGIAEPVSVMVQAFGTEKKPLSVIEKAIRHVFDLKPAGIIGSLSLLRPIYESTATYGHFGRPRFSWEAIDRVAQLHAAC